MTESAESLGCKQKVRAMHRASVTHTVGEVCEILSKGIAVEANSLEQKREAFSTKVELLHTLEEE